MVAVVSGGSRGLGLHAASGLLQAGCSKVFITSRKAKACEEAVAALNALPTKGKAFSIPADSSKIAEIERLVEEVKKETDHVDILFANALPFPGTRPASTIFRYWHGFYHFPLLTGTVFRYSHRFYHFRELGRILPFFDTRRDSTIFRYSQGQFFGTPTDSTISGKDRKSVV